MCLPEMSDAQLLAFLYVICGKLIVMWDEDNSLYKSSEKWKYKANMQYQKIRHLSMIEFSFFKSFIEV